MNNIFKRSVSGIIAFAMTVTSVQISAPHTHTGHAEDASDLVATGIKGDANADGVVTEADLENYEKYLFDDSFSISEGVVKDMDISYTDGGYAYISLQDYLAVKKYLAGETATIEDYTEYTSSETYGPYNLFTGHQGSLDFGLSVGGTLCDSYELVWNGTAPSGIDITDEGYLTGTPSAEDSGKTFEAMVLGKINGEYAGVGIKEFDVNAPAFKITTEDGSFTYGEAIEITKAGTYNITSTDPSVQVKAIETILISDMIAEGEKVTLNLNGMNILYGRELRPGNFIKGESDYGNIDIVLSGSNVIKNVNVTMYTEEDVNIYGGDTDVLSLIGNSSISCGHLTINGGDITVKSNDKYALNLTTLTMLGGSLDASFAPVEGATDGTSYTSMTGVGISCENAVIRRGKLSFSGNEGAIDEGDINGFYVYPLFCDIEVEVSDDGTTYSAVEGSPFADPDNAPSAYEGEGEEATGAVPTNAIDITDKVINKQGLMLHALVPYQYRVEITADDNGYVNYGGDTAASKIFYVNGGEKLPSGITFTANDGWAINGITASINGGAPVVVTDISQLTINGDTVITVATKDTEAPVISGIKGNGVYCGTVEFTVTDDSDVTVTISDEAAQPDSSGVYTIVGDTSSYSIIATDEFGNEIIYSIVVYDKHPSISNYIDNEDGTHTGVCDYCYEDVTDDHSFDDVWYEYDDKQHNRDCKYCDYSELTDHDTYYVDNGDDTHTQHCNFCDYEMTDVHDTCYDDNGDGTHTGYCNFCDYETTNDHDTYYEDNGDGTHTQYCNFCDYETTDDHDTYYTSNDNGTHTEYCNYCEYAPTENHNWGDWYEHLGRCERQCKDCGDYDEADHVYGDWTNNPNTGKHERKCAVCDHTESEDHNFNDWTPDLQTNGHKTNCEDCGFVIAESHTLGEWEEYDYAQHIKGCEDCAFYQLAVHTYGEWEENLNTDMHERECTACGHINEADHVYGEWTDNHETGKHERECIDCGHIEEADHTYGEWTENHESGKHERECTVCGHVEEADHTYGEWNDNRISGKHERECTVCGHVEETDHTYGEWNDNHETGKCDRECTACGHVEEADHIYGEWTENQESGKHERECTVCGHVEEAEHNVEEYMAYDECQHIRFCINCGSYYEIEDHIFGDWEGVDGTNDHKRKCQVCGNTDYDSHNYDDWTDNPGTGKHERGCADCGHVDVDDHIYGIWTDNHETGKCERECVICGHVDESDHTYGEWTDNHETGKCERECEVCGHVDESDHTYGEWIDNPGTGKHERWCEACGHTEEAEHTYGEWIDNHGTGKHERLCTACGHTEEAEHTYGEWTNKPNTGVHERLCTVCGHIEEAEHTYGEWTDNHETGKCERLCTVCGCAEEGEHIYGEWTDNLNTGRHERECTDCGHVEEADHTYGEWVKNDETGKYEKECEACGHTEISDHAYGEWTDNHETGKHDRECAVCGHVDEADHSYGEWTDNHETGKHERECTVCGHVDEVDHEMSDWTTDGDENHKRECTLCGHEETEPHVTEGWKEYDEVNHSSLCTVCKNVAYAKHDFGDAKFIGDGKHSLTCATCGYTVTEDCKGVWEETKKATCTEEGEEEMLCDVCGEKHTKVIEKLPHDFVAGRCSSCYMEDPAIGESSTNPPTGVPFGAGILTLIPASMMVFFARPKSKKDKK